MNTQQNENEISEWRERLNFAIAANRDKVPYHIPQIIDLRTLEGLKEFFIAPKDIRTKNGDWIRAYPIEWAHCFICFKDDSSIRSSEGKLSYGRKPETPQPTMAEKVIIKYSWDTIKKTLDALIWAWGIILDTDIPCGWRKHHENVLHIRDAMLDLLYGGDVSAHADE